MVKMVNCKQLASRRLAVSAIIALGTSAAGALPVSAASVNPWSIGVVSLGNIGSSTKPYTADFQGSAAAVGDAYFSSFSLDSGTNSPSGGYSYYGGGNFSLDGGTVYRGGVQTTGNITLTSGGINGNLDAGGSLFGSGGQVSGNAILGGTNQSSLNSGVTVTGKTSTGQMYNPAFQVSSLTSFFNGASAAYNQAADAGYTDQYGAATIDISKLGLGTHYVTIPGSVLAGDYGVTVTGVAGQTLIINVTGATVNLGSLAFSYHGITQSNVLVNTDATNLTINGGNSFGSGYDLLAPTAAVDYISGSFYGELVVGSLMGGGEQDGGPSFAPPVGPVAIPAGPLPVPADGALVAAGLVGLAALKLLRQRI
jgi:choice-of-anchor A domain-containing protein